MSSRAHGQERFLSKEVRSRSTTMTWFEIGVRGKAVSTRSKACSRQPSTNPPGSNVTIQKPPANRATPVSRPILRRRSQFIIVLHRAYGESSHTSLGESSRQNNNIADLILAQLCGLAQNRRSPRGRQSNRQLSVRWYDAFGSSLRAYGAI